MKESLRIAVHVPGRLPRVVLEGLSEPLVVERKVVPSGVCFAFAGAR